MCDCDYCKHIRENKTYQQSIEEIKEILGKKKMSYCLDCGIDLTGEINICSACKEQVLLEDLFNCASEDSKIDFDINGNALYIRKTEKGDLIILSEKTNRFYSVKQEYLFEALRSFYI
jgi:hypothetical protein